MPHGCLSKAALRIKPFKKHLALSLFFRHQIKKAFAIQCLNIKEKENLFLQSKRCILLPNGIDLKNDIESKTSNKKILFIGRKDIEIKGIDLLLSACKKAKNALVKNKISIYLYGVDVKESESFINLYIKNNDLERIVYNCGPAFNAAKDKLFRSFDFFILTSRTEGQPTALLEAFSYGLPVIITKGTNFSEVVEASNSGIVCDNNVDSIAKALECVCSFSKEYIKTLSKNSLNLSLNYDWMTVSKVAIETYFSIYQNNFESKH